MNFKIYFQATVSNLTSVSSGLEAQLSSTKLLLNDRNKRVAELEEETSTQANTITILEKKLLEGETFRRKLHNQVLELKVSWLWLDWAGVTLDVTKTNKAEECIIKQQTQDHSGELRKWMIDRLMECKDT